MFILDSIYFLAFGLFLAGSREQLCRLKSRRGLWLMTAAIVVDFFGSVLPSSGFKSLSIGIGSSPAIITGIILGVCIWLGFLVCIFIRISERLHLYAAGITLLKILWFADLILFMYGVYNL